MRPDKVHVAKLDFNDTEIAFKPKSDLALRKAQGLFRAFGNQFLVKAGPKLVEWSLGLRLPVTLLVKATIFEQFCGGESISDCESTIQELGSYKIGTILDYSVEGREREEDFDQTEEEVLRTIAAAAAHPTMPFAVFKVTGLGRFDLLAKANDPATPLTRGDQMELAEVLKRMHKLCAAAAVAGVKIMIDAEESWIQETVDRLVLDLMREFNRERPVVFNTVQMYRKDRLIYLKSLQKTAQKEHFFLGIKLVRGAYMEKERAHALKANRPSPIQPDKNATDHDYDEALAFIVAHIDQMSVCAGTHNEESCRKLVGLMAENKLAKNDSRIYFSQLFGMSDNLTFNLAYRGYNVAKYVPYGPVRAVLPYLFRRAEENSSIKGHAGRELQLIEREIKRRASPTKGARLR